jgi:hypothetical protein
LWYNNHSFIYLISYDVSLDIQLRYDGWGDDVDSVHRVGSLPTSGRDSGADGGEVMSGKILAVEGSMQTASAKSVQPQKKHIAQSPHLWMRGHYSFNELRDLVVLLKEHPQGLRPMELNRIVRERELIRTQKGNEPKATTLYHYRRALLNLGIVKYRGGNLVIASDDAVVARLVDSLGYKRILSPQERHAFTELVLRNSECRQNFFDYFMPGDGSYSPGEFVEEGVPVIWQALSREKTRLVMFSHLDREVIGQIATEVEIQAILYGLRYWAKYQLLLIDELYREDIGNLMFPIREPGSVPEETIKQAILSEISPETEWTVLSVQDLIYKWAVGLRVPVTRVFNTITHIYHEHPGLVALVSISRRLAAFTANSRFREDFELRSSYLQDERGRYISHIRFHRDLKFGGERQ